MSRILRYLLRKFYLLTAIALIGLAVLVQLGRSFSPLVNDYREPLANYLSRELNAEVQLGGLSAQWDGLKPVLEIEQLSIRSQSGQPILALGQARLRLDLLRSLFNWRPVWRNLRLEGAELEFAQSADGLWFLPGLPRSSASTPEVAQLDALVDMLLLANRIEFSQSSLGFEFANGQKIVLDSPQLLLENHRSFHRLTLEVDIEQRKRAAYLVVEGSGDPRDRAQFRANAYLSFKDFPTSEPLATATALLLGEAAERQMRGEGAVNAELWFNTRPRGEGLDIAGQLALQTLYLPLFERQYQLDSFTTALSGYWLRSGSWQLTLPGISAGLNEAQISDVNLAVSTRGPGEPLQVQLDVLRLSNWAAILDQAGVFGEGQLQSVLRQLAPRGQLSDLSLTLPLNQPEEWQLEARAEQLAVAAWRGVPALTGVDGYVRAGQGGGFINLDSRNGFSAHFDPTYDQPMQYQQASGQIAWHLQPEKNRIYVNSGALELRQDEEALRGYLWLAIPWRRNTGDIDLYLHIGAQQLAADLHPKYLPAVLPENLRTWLEKALGEHNTGLVRQGGVLFRGTLNTPNRMARSHQVYLEIEDATLDYHADWPDLRQVTGRLLVDDNQVRAEITQGKVFDSDLTDIRLLAGPHPQGKGALLEIQGQVHGPAGDGLRLLRESQLRQVIGNTMDTWLLDGDYNASLALAVPLQPGTGGARQSVRVDVKAPRFELNNFQLVLEDISGQISFDHQRGLSSEGLTGQLFGETTLLGLATQHPDGQDAYTRISLSGRAPTESLALWSQRPELLFLQGSLSHETRIDLPHRAGLADADPRGVDLVNADALLARVSVDSDLSQIAIDLPAPLGKVADEERKLSLRLDIHQRTQTLAVNYTSPEDPLLQLRLQQERQTNQLLNVNVALGARARLPAEPQFLVSGQVPQLQLDEWRLVRDRYLDYTRRFKSASGGAADPWGDPLQSGRVAGLPLRLDLTLGSHVLGPLRLEELNLTAWQEESHWHLSFANPMLVGNLQMPLQDGEPMTINLQELHLTRQLLGDRSTAPAPVDGDLAISFVSERPSFHPRDLPRANIHLRELYLDDHNYGSWSLDLRPDSQGALFDNIRGQMRGLTIEGIAAPRANGQTQAEAASHGAKLYWLEDDRGERTRFIGALTAGDLTEVMLAWQKPDMIESTSARFQVDLTWPGAPGQFVLANLDGQVDLLLTDGRFKRGAGAGEGILRLLSLVNFDTLARRLRLDFSDLYKSGLAYDQVKGRMEFRDGNLYFAEPLQVQSPSSRMQMAGTINLRDETVDARLVAALPVAGNLTFLAALATGLPAAAGIYLVSKLFRKQVDQATSVSYSIRGDWDNPKMRFDRLFESEASLRSSVSGRREEDDGQEIEKARTE